MAWAGSDVKDHPVPTLCHRHLPLEQIAQMLTNSGSSLRGEGGLSTSSLPVVVPPGRGRAGHRMAAAPQAWVSLHFPAPDSPQPSAMCDESNYCHLSCRHPQAFERAVIKKKIQTCSGFCWCEWRDSCFVNPTCASS